MAGRVRAGRDALPPLSLGLSSVRFIVNRIEADFTRASDREIAKYDPSIEDHDSTLDHSNGILSRFLLNLAYAFSRCVPSVSFGNFGILAVATGFVAPRMLTYLVVYPFCRLVFGTLYPAYASYKAVRTKNLKEYVKWMMYWIVFALFTCTETFTDVFLSWFPFYYEVKIVIVLWLLSPATKGSSILYRKFVHPALCRREQEIDEYIAKAKDQGYHTVLNLGTKGVNYATTVIMQTAIKGGGGLVQQIKKSYSLSDLTECEPRDERARGEADDVLESQIVRRSTNKTGCSSRRSASESSRALYFPELDAAAPSDPTFSHIKSSEDISSGYSSAGDSAVSLARAGSIGARKVRAGRTAVTSIKRPLAAEDSEVIIEELHDDDHFEYSNMPALLNMPSPLYLSHTEPSFIYQYVGDQVKIIQVLGTPLEKHNESKNQPFAFTSTTFDKEIEVQENKAEKFSENIPLHKDENNNGMNDVDELSFEDAPSEPSVHVEKSVELDDNTTNQYLDTNDLDVQSTKQEKVFLNVEVVSHETCDQIDKSEFNPTNTLIDETSKPDVKVIISKDDTADTTSLDTSDNDNASAESDDEASFGTPDNSPKSKRKLVKGKHGKGKAPPPPSNETTEEAKEQKADLASLTTSQESLEDIFNTLPSYTINRDPSPAKNFIVNPIAEIKRRHKSKSPGKITRSNHSAIGKLLQIPGKLAFWHKNDKSKSDKPASSEDDSRRSSTVEKADDFQSCLDLNAVINTDAVITEVIEKCDDHISFKDASDFESDVITHDIIEKSDVLQKLIEAKIESHPEYKYVSNEDIVVPSTSKSTDV